MANVRRNGLALAMLLVRASFATPYIRSTLPPLPNGNSGTDRGSREFWYHLVVSIILVLAGGAFAGYVAASGCVAGAGLILHFHYRLTLGLMGLDELHLRVLATSSENLTEKRNAQKGISHTASSNTC